MSSELSIKVDVLNPGQYFACCGLLELADRLWREAKGCFIDDEFHISSTNPTDHVSLPALIGAFKRSALSITQPKNETSSALHLGSPFDLTIDWWQEPLGHGSELKPWAGRMAGPRIAGAMRLAIPDASDSHILDFGCVVRDPAEPTKKVEPFYFDARRGASALARDVGFSTDPLGIETRAHPAVEVMCLVGLQRFRPFRVSRRNFRYWSWRIPLHPEIAAAVAAGTVQSLSDRCFEFESRFRTDNRKHKAFAPAKIMTRSFP